MKQAYSLLFICALFISAQTHGATEMRFPRALGSLIKPESLYSAVRTSVVSAPFLVNRPALHKIAEEHFGKIAGSVAGLVGACAVGYGIHTFIKRKANEAFRITTNNNVKAKESVVTDLFSNGFDQLLHKIKPDSTSVSASATYAGSTETLLEITAQNISGAQGQLAVRDFLHDRKGHQRQYLMADNVLTRLYTPTGDRLYTPDPHGIQHALKGHALAHPESIGGTISQPLPVFNSYTPRYKDSCQYDPYNTYTGIPSNRQVAIIDSANNNFLWPDESWILHSKNFAALFHWATLHQGFALGQHDFLIQKAETTARTGSSPRYNFQVASINKTTDELGTTFTYQFTINNQQKTFSVSGYQTEEAFTNDWRYVWQMIEKMSSEELRSELIKITKDAVDQHHKREQYSSQAASSEPVTMLIKSLPDNDDDSSSSEDKQTSEDSE